VSVYRGNALGLGSMESDPIDLLERARGLQQGSVQLINTKR
jgi:hypothetical protein